MGIHQRHRCYPPISWTKTIKSSLCKREIVMNDTECIMLGPAGGWSTREEGGGRRGLSYENKRKLIANDIAVRALVLHYPFRYAPLVLWFWIFLFMYYFYFTKKKKNNRDAKNRRRYIVLTWIKWSPHSCVNLVSFVSFLRFVRPSEVNLCWFCDIAENSETDPHTITIFYTFSSLIIHC